MRKSRRSCEAGWRPRVNAPPGLDAPKASTSFTIAAEESGRNPYLSPKGRVKRGSDPRVPAF